MASGTARWIALAASLATLCASLGMIHEFATLPAPTESSANSAVSPIQPRYPVRYHWLTVPASTIAGVSNPGFKMEFQLGVDGISLALVVLTTVLTVSCVLVSWEAIRERESEFYTAMLLLETALVAVFCAFDLVLFYVAFEFTLIPLFFMIGQWGGPQRRYAAIKFFLYTLTGSLITLLGVVALVMHVSTEGLTTPCSIPDIAAWVAQHPMSPQLQVALFLAMSAGFMVKVPVIPLHTWLPLAQHGSADGGQRVVGWRVVEAGNVRFSAAVLAAIPGGLCDGGPADRGRTGGRRNHLRVAVCAGTAGCEEAGRV